MRLKVTLIALAVSALPALAAAEGCGWQHMKDSANTCPTGSTLDAKTGTCVKLTTS
ncbi:hypothetical protein [Tropicimonas marinistellae]|uniref:hypothetical protein n=1 Tax=Tropicimonas marinistellae TaxID=1739787 RepID=UPI001372C694|nr:hypothetical protein [Tropicimonas marinistellae]